MVLIIFSVSQTTVVDLDNQFVISLGLISLVVDLPFFLGASLFWTTLFNNRSDNSARAKNFCYRLNSPANLYLHVGS